MTNEQKYKTAEERISAFDKLCNAKNEMNRDCIGCKLHYCDRGGGIFYKCFAHWLALPYEEKLDACPFCGGECRTVKNLYERFVVGCDDCCYCSRDFDSEAEAIAAHNRVARAVRAAEESEAKQ